MASSGIFLAFPPAYLSISAKNERFAPQPIYLSLEISSASHNAKGSAHDMKIHNKVLLGLCNCLTFSLFAASLTPSQQAGPEAPAPPMRKQQQVNEANSTSSTCREGAQRDGRWENESEKRPVRRQGLEAGAKLISTSSFLPMHLLCYALQ